MWRPFLVAILIVASVTVARSQSSLACSCATATSDGAYENADHVFRGRVVEIEVRENDPTGAMRARLDIDTVWKGEVVSEALLQGGAGSACLVSWQEEETYIVFARASTSGALNTSGCNGTSFESVRHDLVTPYGPGTPVPAGAPAHENVIKREPMPPYPAALQPVEAENWPLPWVVALAAVAGGFLALVLIARRRLS